MQKKREREKKNQSSLSSYISQSRSSIQFELLSPDAYVCVCECGFGKVQIYNDFYKWKKIRRHGGGEEEEEGGRKLVRCSPHEWVHIKIERGKERMRNRLATVRESKWVAGLMQGHDAEKEQEEHKTWWKRRRNAARAKKT